MNNEEFYKSLTDIEKGIVDFYTFNSYLFRENKRVLEIGSGWGIFTRIAMMLSNSYLEYTTIDKIDKPKSFEENTRGFEHRINKILGDSTVELQKYKDDTYDLIFIDGDHGYEGFKKDFINSWRVIKSGGYILIDDIYHRHNFGDGPKDDYGIMEAVSELAFEYKFIINIYPVAHGIGLIQVMK